MRSRIIQSDSQPEPTPPDGVDAAPETRGPAARIGRWSATHRKTAILGWLVFVDRHLRLMSSGVSRRSSIDRRPRRSPARRARPSRSLDDAGLKPTEELVFIQSYDRDGRRRRRSRP